MSTSALREDAGVPAGDVSVATLAWRYRGVVRVTVIAKATFTFALDGGMTPIPPQPVLRAEVHHGKSPARSIRLTTDLAPYLNRADVLLTGHAHAPQGALVEMLPVRLGIFDGAEPVLDKTVIVRQRGGVKQVPLVYERAYGGVGWAENPLGVGVPEGSGEPNVVDPHDVTRRAGFGPVGRGWPARKRLLGGLKRQALEAEGLIDLPDDLDWEYFQAAPADQRIGFLRGDEWIVLEGLHPQHARLRTCLPGARGLGLVYGLGPWGVAEGQPVALHADTLRIDADEEHGTLTFRATFPVADEAALPCVRVALGVELPGRPIPWPDPASFLSPPSESPESAVMPLSSEDFEPDGGNVLEGMMRFEASPEGDGSAVLTEATLAATPGASETLQSTLWSEPRPEPRSPSALPFMRSASPAPPPPPPSPGVPRAYAHVRLSEGGGTMMQTPEDDTFAAHRSVLPFASPAPPAPPPPLPSPLPVAGRDPPAPAVAVGAPAQPRPASTAPAPPRAEGIEIVNATGLSLGLVPWKMHPSRDCITVFARATCDIVPGGPARLRPAAEPVGDERFDGEALVHPTDRALFKVRADVVAVAEAHAARGPVRFMEARFAFGSEGNAFDRILAIFGDRRWERGPVADRPTEPEPFLVMPVRWDRAFGGPKLDANPAGAGYPDRMRRGPRTLPNLEDPVRRLRTPHQVVDPACFAPIPLAWKDRLAARGRARDAWPLLPEDLDWTRFQAAPAAQQLGFLRGDEPFVLRGMHARHADLEGSLPGVRARCFALVPGRAAPVEEVPLRLDTVVFAVADLRVDLVFRGVLPVPDERAPDVRALHLFTEAAPGPGMTLDEARERILRP